ncbi:MAG: Pr6Pr family membrane protein [Bacilli bacterium]|nr:Pr6Pr family membrane protein [Bacilli bacterium]
MRIKNKKISIIYKLIICLIAVFSIIAVTGILDNKLDLRVFSMFTTISNILCVIYFTIDILYITITKKDKSFIPVLKGSVVTCMALTFITSAVILKMTFSFKTFYDSSFLGLHYIVPIMTFLDWVLFDVKGTIKKYEPFVWMIIPFIYTSTAFISAFLGGGLGISDTSKYPYQFMDIDEIGFINVSVTNIALFLFFIVTGYICFMIDKYIFSKNGNLTNKNICARIHH